MTTANGKVTRSEKRRERRLAKLRLAELAKPLKRRARRKFAPKPFQFDGGDCRCRPSKSTRTLATARVQELAEPKYRRDKYHPPGRSQCQTPCRCAGDFFCSSRVQELALPLVRTIASSVSVYKPILGQERSQNLDTLMDKSLKTVYSKIYHCTRPERPTPRRKLTAEEWQELDEWLEKHAKAKRNMSEECLPIKRSESRPYDMDRIERLARPKHVTPAFSGRIAKISDPIVPIKKSVLNFEITPKLLALTAPFKPPIDDEMEMYENPYEIPREYRNVKSSGLAGLATPKASRSRKRFVKGDNASLVFDVSKAAMKAKPSEYTKKLAEARKNMQEDEKPNPFGVSKAAASRKPMAKDKVDYYTKLATPIERSVTA